MNKSFLARELEIQRAAGIPFDDAWEFINSAVQSAGGIFSDPRNIIKLGPGTQSPGPLLGKRTNGS